MTARVFVTGGAGFIGSNFVRHVLRTSDDMVTVYDALTYAGAKETLADIASDPRFRFVVGDICDREAVQQALDGHDVVVHFAAESHVDRSIVSPDEFVRTNCLGTNVLCDVARGVTVERFVHISTDEVYGSIAEGSFSETDLLQPRSPYSASKAGSDMIAAAYRETHGLPVVITRSSNNFGPYQYPEKIIPLFVTNLLNGETVPLYGDGLNVRDWCYVEDNCAAIDVVRRRGHLGRTYNVGAGNEVTNRDLTDRLLALCGSDESSVRYVEDRLGHDRRYSVDTSAVRGLGWSPSHDLDSALERTVAWYRDNRQWWEPLKARRREMKVLVTGAGGQLGHDVVRAFADEDVVAASHAMLDTTDRAAVQDAVSAAQPDAVIHCAAWTAVDACESDTDRAFVTNALAVRYVADAAESVGAHLCHVSTDYVFDGLKTSPYDEQDTPAPLSVYGASKLAGEREAGPQATIVRTSWVCGLMGANMVKTVLRLGAQDQDLAFVDDQHGCPTFTEDLAAMIRTLTTLRVPGLVHVTNQGSVSWFEFARAVLAEAGDNPDRVRAIRTAELRPPRPAPRPANSVLDNAVLRSAGFPLLDDFRVPLARLVRQLVARP